MHTLSELTYIADQISHEPVYAGISGNVYTDVMSAIGIVRDQAAEEIAALAAENERLNAWNGDMGHELRRQINALTAERDALRTELAETWRPLAEERSESLCVSYYDHHADDESASYDMFDVGAEYIRSGDMTFSFTDDDTRICRRVVKNEGE